MTNDAPATSEFQAPYMSWTTFDSIVDQFRAGGLPAQIDRSVLSSRAGGDQSQFLRAARSFGFLADNYAPTTRFREYVKDPEARPRLMAEVLRESYPNVVALPQDATPQMLADQIRALNVDGDTARKATAFYLNAARFAELPLSPHFKATRPGAGGRKSTRRTKSRDESSDTQTPPLPPPDPIGELHPAIITLVKSLPAAQLGEKVPFPEEERDAWFEYAKATFNLIYTRAEADAAHDGARGQE